MAKPRKAQEPAGSYSAKVKPQAVKLDASVRHVDGTEARKAIEKLLVERKELLQKLAK